MYGNAKDIFADLVNVVNKSALIYLPKPGKLGGIETHAIRFTRLLVGKGWNVTLVATGNSLHRDLKGQLEAMGAEYSEMRCPSEVSSFTGSLWFVLLFLVSHLFKRWDLVYTNGHTSFAPLFWLVGRKGGIVMHHHHTSADQEEQRSWRSSYRWILRHAPLLIGCSNATADELKKVAPQAPVIWLPYLIDSDMPYQHRHPVNDAPNFVYIGRLVRSKGIHLIVELARRKELSHVRWSIYGSEGDFKADDFTDIEGIDYRGAFTTRSELVEALSGADYLVLFSDHCEGMPISLLEASSMGIPWIATDIGGVKELAVVDPHNILLPRRPSLETCAQSIAAALEIRRSVGLSKLSETRQPTELFQKRFSYRSAAAQWNQLLGN